MKHFTFLALSGALLGISSVEAAPKTAVKPTIKATIVTVSPASLQSVIKKQRGKVVLVNFWATWCAPCVAELPGLAQLQKQYGRRGLTVLLVSGDEVSAKPLISKTLAARGHSKSFLIGGDVVKFFDKFDPKFKGAVALPRTYIYNRGGARVKVVENDHTAAEYAAMISPYL